MNKTTKAEKNPYRRALLAGCIGVALLLALLFIYTLCASKLLLPRGREALWGRAVLCLASCAAAFLACGKGGTDGRGSASVSGSKALRAAASASVLLVFVVFAGIFTETSSVLNMSLLWNLLCILFGSAAGMLLTLRRRKRRRRRD